MQFVCDGVNDCEDLETSTESSTLMVGKTSSDEMNCRSKTCTENQFICEKSKACIPLELVCDGNNDCPDEGETDEICKDEEESITIIPRPTCLSTEQSCLSGECIPKSFFCDGKFDCDDMSDEREVCLIIDEMEIPPTCEADEFTCKDKTCIKLSKICNLESDCPDNSDENMTLCQSYPAYCKQSMDRYLCSHGGCINASLICNGADDCGDFSDEMSCNINECEFTSCGEHAECRDLKIGMECVCNSGEENKKSEITVINQPDDIDIHVLLFHLFSPPHRFHFQQRQSDAVRRHQRMRVSAMLSSELNGFREENPQLFPVILHSNFIFSIYKI